MRTASLILVALLLATTSHPIHGQALSRQPEPAHDSAWPSIGAGLGLGLGGWAVGGFSAAYLARDCSDHEDDYCEITAFLIGAAIGGTFGMALGVHAGNGWRGSLAPDFLTGAQVWGAGIGLVAATEAEEPLIYVVAVTIPVAQLVATILVERATGRARRDQTVSVLILPQPDGRMGLGASIRF